MSIHWVPCSQTWSCLLSALYLLCNDEPLLHHVNIPRSEKTTAYRNRQRRWIHGRSQRNSLQLLNVLIDRVSRLQTQYPVDRFLFILAARRSTVLSSCQLWLKLSPLKIAKSPVDVQLTQLTRAPFIIGQSINSAQPYHFSHSIKSSTSISINSEIS